MGVFREDVDECVYIGYKINENTYITDIQNGVVKLRIDKQWDYSIRLNEDKELHRLRLLNKQYPVKMIDFENTNVIFRFLSHIGTNCENLHLKTNKSFILSIDNIITSTLRNLKVDCKTLLINKQKKNILTKFNNVSLHANTMVCEKESILRNIMFGRDCEISTSKIRMGDIDKESINKFIEHIKINGTPDQSLLGIDRRISNIKLFALNTTKSHGIIIYNIKEIDEEIPSDLYTASPEVLSGDWVIQNVFYGNNYTFF